MAKCDHAPCTNELPNAAHYRFRKKNFCSAVCLLDAFPELKAPGPTDPFLRARLLAACVLNSIYLYKFVPDEKGNLIPKGQSDLDLAHTLLDSLGTARNRIWPNEHTGWIVHYPDASCIGTPDFVEAVTRLAELYPGGAVPRDAKIRVPNLQKPRQHHSAGIPWPKTPPEGNLNPNTIAAPPNIPQPNNQDQQSNFGGATSETSEESFGTSPPSD